MFVAEREGEREGEGGGVINVCGDHWITISNIGCTDSSSIKVFDSLGGRLPGSKKKGCRGSFAMQEKDHHDSVRKCAEAAW